MTTYVDVQCPVCDREESIRQPTLHQETEVHCNLCGAHYACSVEMDDQGNVDSFVDIIHPGKEE